MKRIMALILLLSLVLPWSVGKAEDKLIYVLCRPESHLKVRKTPFSRRETGRLECGDAVMTDGKMKNGYLHIIGITEDGEGWIHAGYVVDDEPVIEECRASIAANGRVMTRKCISGKRSRWLEVCSDVIVYARSEEWAVTNKGYVRTKYLEEWHE